MRPTSTRPARDRAATAVAVAVALGAVVALLTWTGSGLLRDCVPATGTATGGPLCPEGKAVFARALVAALSVAALWLLGYVATELLRAPADDLRELADVAVVVGAAVAAIPALLVGMLFAVALLGVLSLVVLARRQVLVLALATAVGIALSCWALILVPFAGGAALAWSTALLLRGAAARRNGAGTTNQGALGLQ